ncbi:MAG TPA: Asp-tRNA(Asn)/Glu-tRNA(Gln) amidotransferase subunit GatC [Dehalococcoidia bacterium]|nr:Asp-tRNA(Asn)/Glu-tRNA(Gln) amidotransferase subunit GatC [Dehalococcoidia bacterium]
MPLTPDEVKRIARLARVGLSDDEVAHFQVQLSEILDYFQRLREVDTEKLPPTARTLAMHNVMRDDEPRPSFGKEEVLANAPQREDDLFRVRAILE